MIGPSPTVTAYQNIEFGFKKTFKDFQGNQTRMISDFRSYNSRKTSPQNGTAQPHYGYLDKGIYKECFMLKCNMRNL